jgi:hypothetical protein
MTTITGMRAATTVYLQSSRSKISGTDKHPNQVKREVGGEGDRALTQLFAPWVVDVMLAWCDCATVHFL